MVFLGVLFFAVAGLAADLPNTFRVHRVDIEGTHDLKDKEIRSTLLLSPPSRWRFWKKRPMACGEDLSDDADRIIQLYKSNGYYHSQVTYDVQISKGSGASPASAHVTYHIEEGMPVTVDSILIDFEDLEIPVSVENLLGAIPLKPGMRFEEKAYRKSKQTIQKQFGGNGYPLAEITGKALIYPSTKKADITFSVDPGQLCFFGSTTVVGDGPFVSEKVLQRSRTYLSGEVYDTAKVEKSQRNLYNLDVFKAAVIQPDLPDPETGQVSLNLELKPKKKQSIKLGVGYGNEDGIRLRAGWTYRNPFRRAGRLTFEAKQTDLLRKASTGYSLPYFWDSRSALDTEVGTLQEFLDSYESLELFTTMRITRTMKYHLKLTTAYILEYSELTDLNLTDPQEQAAYREDHSFLTSSIFLEINRNTADNELNPKKGSNITGFVEIASSLIGSDLTYVKPSLEFKQYIDLPLGIVLAGRVRFETIFDHEDAKEIPVYKRLFLGGANTVRGYAYQKLGPLDETGNPLGGQSSALANIELRRPIIGILSGVLFLDMGTVNEEKFNFAQEEIRTSAGAGLRVDTPLGPIRLDYGYQLNPPELPGDNADSSIWSSDRRRIHFNIGHAF
jgi:outer membrane protein insertion porin family/translocation and assembly module TamA